MSCTWSLRRAARHRACHRACHARKKRERALHGLREQVRKEGSRGKKRSKFHMTAPLSSLATYDGTPILVRVLPNTKTRARSHPATLHSLYEGTATTVKHE